MAYEVPGLLLPFPAGADFSAGAQFRFCDLNSSAQVVNPTNHGKALGVRQNRPQSGKAATVMLSGISIVEAGAAITAGAYVETNATGQVVTAASGSAIVGRALETCTASGQQIAVLLILQTTLAP
jgi:predicted RecA/RadA family phage recombinase